MKNVCPVCMSWMIEHEDNLYMTVKWRKCSCGYCAKIEEKIKEDQVEDKDTEGSASPLR